VDQRRDYQLKFQLKREEVMKTLEAYDKKREPLRKKRNELRSELSNLDITNSKARMDYEGWERDIAVMRRQGIIK
jgi:hypothetical protein